MLIKEPSFNISLIPSYIPSTVPSVKNVFTPKTVSFFVKTQLYQHILFYSFLQIHFLYNDFKNSEFLTIFSNPYQFLHSSRILICLLKYLKLLLSNQEYYSLSRKAPVKDIFWAWLSVERRNVFIFELQNEHILSMYQISNISSFINPKLNFIWSS